MLTDEELELGGFRFEDLQEKRIVSNRTDLLRKQTDLGFPRAIKTGASQAMFLKAEVYAWLRERAAQRDALPDAGIKRERGRPPKAEHAPSAAPLADAMSAAIRAQPKTPKPAKRAARVPEARVRENAGAG